MLNDKRAILSIARCPFIDPAKKDRESMRPTVAVIFGMAILFDYDDHEPPHLHVRAPDFRARIDLGDLGVTEISGRMRSRDLIRVRNWAVRHRAALYENWNRARRKQALLKIED